MKLTNLRIPQGFLAAGICISGAGLGCQVEAVEGASEAFTSLDSSGEGSGSTESESGTGGVSGGTQDSTQGGTAGETGEETDGEVTCADISQAIIDANLRAQICETLGKSKGEPCQFTCEEAKTVKKLNAAQLGIKSAVGLSHLSGLEELNLGFNSLSSLEGLNGLSNLRVLHLEYQRDINSDPSLKATGFFLADAVALEELYLQGNALPGVEGLAGLKSLRILYLNNQQDENMQKVLKSVGLSLGGLSALTELNLSDNAISKIDGLWNLGALRKLDLANNQITKLEGLINLKNLTSLHLQNNRVAKLEGLENLDQLQILDLDHNKIADIEGLENLKSLRELDLSSNQIDKITGLQTLQELRVFRLEKQLDQQNNRVLKTPGQGLVNLKKLELVSLEGNAISKISGFDGLTGLQTLNLQFNQLEQNVAGLAHLTSLDNLYLRDNNLTPDQLKIISTMQWLGEGDVIGFAANNYECPSWLLAAAVATIQEKGATVVADKGCF